MIGNWTISFSFKIKIDAANVKLDSNLIPDVADKF